MSEKENIQVVEQMIVALNARDLNRYTKLIDDSSVSESEMVPASVRGLRLRESEPLMNDPTGRRHYARYPLHLAVDSTFRKGLTPRSAPIQCAGQIHDLSSGACCLDLMEPALIYVGMCAELRAAWPVKLQGVIALQLHVAGGVLRVDGPRIVVAIRRYQFETRGNRRIAVTGA